MSAVKDSWESSEQTQTSSYTLKAPDLSTLKIKERR